MNKLSQYLLSFSSCAGLLSDKRNLLTVTKLAAVLLFLTSGPALAATEEQMSRAFEASSGGRLVVDVDFGSIDVTTNGADREVSVNVWRKVARGSAAEEKRFLRDHPVVFLHEGDTVTVRCRSNEPNQWFRSWKKWFRGWLNRNEGRLTIVVPAQFGAKLNTSGDEISVSGLDGDVTAHTSGGSLRFTRLHGPLNGATSGGSIQVTDCEGTIVVRTSGGGIKVSGGGGSLDARTSGGSASVRDFAGPASVKTSGGGITISNVKGTVRGSTSGGRITATLSAPVPGDVTLTTSGGGVSVEVAETASFNLDARTSGGDVTCDLPVTLQGKMRHSSMKGVVNGGGPAIVLRTSGGGIHVKRL